MLGAVAAGTGALAAWAWGDPRSYLAFTLGGDPGPSLDPSPLLSPLVAPPAAAASGGADLSLEPLPVQAPRGSVTGLSLRGTL